MRTFPKRQSAIELWQDSRTSSRGPSPGLFCTYVLRTYVPSGQPRRGTNTVQASVSGIHKNVFVIRTMSKASHQTQQKQHHGNTPPPLYVHMRGGRRRPAWGGFWQAIRWWCMRTRRKERYHFVDSLPTSFTSSFPRRSIIFFVFFSSLLSLPPPPPAPCLPPPSLLIRASRLARGEEKKNKTFVHSLLHSSPIPHETRCRESS